jgi:hypothetical protein
MSVPLVYVIVLSWNGLDWLKVCIPSLLKTKYKNFKTVVVDNGSTDGSQRFIKKNFPAVTLIENDENLGFSAGNNIGIKYAIQKGADYVVLLNNDTVVDEYWLGELVKAAGSKEVGACTSKFLLYDKKGVINSAGGQVNFLGFAWPVGLNEKDRGQYTEREVAFGCAASLLLKTTVLKEVGLFDPSYFIYADDTDLSWRIRLRGYKILYAPKSVVWHKYSATMQTRRKKYKYLIERNRITTILKNYSLKSLLLISPALVFIEFSVLLYSICDGWPLEKIRGWVWNLLHLKEIIKKRREVQKIRKVEDKKIIELFSGPIEYADIKSFWLEKIINPLLSLYWKFVRRFI